MAYSYQELFEWIIELQKQNAEKTMQIKALQQHIADLNYRIGLLENGMTE